MKLIGPVLLLAASAWGEAPRVPLTRGFTPNPMLVGVQRAEGGAAPLEAGFASCKDVAPGAQVSRSPVAVLEVGEGITHLTLQASQSDRVIARTADGATSCGGKRLTLEVKPGPLEVFVVTEAAVADGAAGKLRVFDADRPRILPDAVKTVSVDGRSPVVLSGELAAGRNIPDAQLDVTAKLDHVEWKLDGAAGEVWLSPLSLDDAPPVKAGDALAPGRYAVWIRGAKTGAFTVTATVAAPAEAAVATAPGDDAPEASSRPAADAEPAPEKEPRVKSVDKLKKQVQSCIDRHPEWPDAAKRCTPVKADKSRAKLEAPAKKSSAKQRAAELAAMAKRAKAVATRAK